MQVSELVPSEKQSSVALHPTLKGAVWQIL